MGRKGFLVGSAIRSVLDEIQKYFEREGREPGWEH